MKHMPYRVQEDHLEGQTVLLHAVCGTTSASLGSQHPARQWGPPSTKIMSGQIRPSKYLIPSYYPSVPLPARAEP